MADQPQIMQKRLRSLSELDKIEQPKRRYQASQKGLYQERMYLNDYQYSIYKTAMSGLSAYSSKELYNMPFQKKRKISNFHTKVQKTLNLWKQQLINQLFEQLCSIKLNNFPQNPFNTVFKDTKIGMQYFGKRTDDLFHSSLTFEQLKVNRKQIINKLITERILPENFLQIQRL